MGDDNQMRIQSEQERKRLKAIAKHLETNGIKRWDESIKKKLKRQRQED